MIVLLVIAIQEYSSGCSNDGIFLHVPASLVGLFITNIIDFVNSLDVYLSFGVTSEIITNRECHGAYFCKILNRIYGAVFESSI